MNGNELTVVWTGRFQPVHNGHLAILSLSLATFAHPHAVILTSYQGWSPPSAYAEAAAASYATDRNPLTVWERFSLMRLALTTLDSPEIAIVTAPRHDLDWPRASEFYPPNRLIALTEKDEFERAKADLWVSRGERVHVFRDIDPLTTTEIKRRVADGADWRSFMPSTGWAYFEEIGGPARVFGLAH